jgi:hypothetical protein
LPGTRPRARWLCNEGKQTRAQHFPSFACRLDLFRLTLVETVLGTVRDVDNLDDLGSQPSVQQITTRQIALEIGTTGQNQPGHVDLVGGDEMLDGQLGDFTDIVVSLFVTQTGETQRRLSSSTVLLGEVDSEFVDDFTGVSCESTEELRG